MGTAVENEFKFTSYEHLDADIIIDKLMTFLSQHRISYNLKSKHSVDSYFDTTDFDLYKMDCILRRKNSSNGKIKLTMKRPMSNELGMMSRLEIERASDGSFDDLMDFFHNEFPSMTIDDDPVLYIDCDRTAFDYTDGSNIKLSLDHCFYMFKDNKKDFFEIELESMDDHTKRDFDSIGILDFIESLEFQQVTVSKYQRGIQWKLGL